MNSMNSMNSNPVLHNFAYCLAHVPDLVRHGSKPRRAIQRQPELEAALARSLRSHEAALFYPPNQVFIGNLTPQELAGIPRPWFAPEPVHHAAATPGAFGEILAQDAFLALLWRADVLAPPLFQVTAPAAERFQRLLADRAFFPGKSTAESDHGVPADDLQRMVADESALPVFSEGERIGAFRRDDRAEGREDDNLTAPILLENLCAKASGAHALTHLLRRAQLQPDAIDFVISCGEEACGDRYQRGGGGMAKAIAEMCGCTRASGMDIKNFCAAPASAIVTAGAMVKAGLYRRVAVVGGGSLAKLGMKFEAFLERKMPVLDDCLASMAFLVTPDDGISPVLRLEAGAVGSAPVGSSTSDEAVYRHFLLKPLQHLGLCITDVDRFAPELHNPEIMELAGSGDVVRKNYRTIAALAVMEGELDRAQMNPFIERVGMTGFAPTQGHIPSAVPYLGHASVAMQRGEITRAMFLGKASIFLNRCTQLYDGVSFLLEANPRAGGSARPAAGHGELTR